MKKAHIGVIPGLKEYVAFFLSDDMIGPDSPLWQNTASWLPPMPSAIRAKFEAGTAM